MSADEVDPNPIRTLRLRHEPEPFKSIGELAKAAGVHENTIRGAEERRTRLNDATLLKVAKALGADPVNLDRDLTAARHETKAAA